jgi:hypothetical protein
MRNASSAPFDPERRFLLWLDFGSNLNATKMSLSKKRWRRLPLHQEPCSWLALDQSRLLRTPGMRDLVRSDSINLKRVPVIATYGRPPLDDFRAGIERAIALGWLGTYLKITDSTRGVRRVAAGSCPVYGRLLCLKRCQNVIGAVLLPACPWALARRIRSPLLFLLTRIKNPYWAREFLDGLGRRNSSADRALSEPATFSTKNCGATPRPGARPSGHPGH